MILDPESRIADSGMTLWSSMQLACLFALVLVGSAAASSAGASEGRRQDADPTASRPTAVHLETLAFDATRNRLVLFGGGRSSNGAVIQPGETWEWTGDQWVVAVSAAAGPGGRSGHGMGFDPAERRIVLYGGVRETAQGQPAEPLCDTWTYDGLNWRQITGATCVTTRPFSRPVYDQARGAMLLVEGGDPSHPTRLWRWQGGDWSLVDSSGPRRSPQDGVAYDRSRAVLVAVVLTGADAGVWEWDGGAWTQKTTQVPSARTRYAFAYEPRLQRVVLLGGRRGSPPNPLDDAWLWDGSGWSVVAVDEALRVGGPSARASATLVEDPVGQGLLLYGGAGFRGGVVGSDWVILDDLWRFDRRGWIPLLAPRGPDD